MPNFAARPVILIAACLLLAIAAMPPLASADEYKLPDSAEISTYSPEALTFYSGGVESLDRADEVNAFSQLVKAAQLQPNAVRLNTIAAALASRRAKATAGAASRNHYETAILLYENLLRRGELDEAFRRDIMNRLRVLREERDSIDQRDTKRDAIGALFITELNRTYVEQAKKSDATPTPTPAPPVGAPLPPGAPGLQPPTTPGNPLVPGVGVPQYPTALPTPAPVGGGPGQFPVSPGGSPSDPLPGAPGQIPPAGPASPDPAPSRT